MKLKEEGFRLPEELAGLSQAELDELCGEIRKRLIEVVAKNGGHLASNLGVVELTVALYSCYNPMKDRIVWDVGHQAYVHKILTGRNAQMDTLRTFGGLSGFPKREESEADAFNTGHSSTSVSAALGMARAAELAGEKRKIVAVIGDGALTGGMAFEALNDAAQSQCDITIVLNDNGMSISKNVGGLARYLRRIRSKKSYMKAKSRIRRMLMRVPRVGLKLAKWARRVKNSIKFLIVPGEFFENLGLTYVGPVDGHDIPALRDALRRSDEYAGPVLVHVITRKGKGCDYAAEDPVFYHGAGPFNADTGKAVPEKSVSLSGAFAETLCTLAGKDPKICAVTAAMQTGTGLEAFHAQFPKRFFDVGIAEQHAITMSAGMSVMGSRPVVAIYSTFLQRAYDQLLHDVSLQRIPLVIGIDRAGVAGQDGETHQGLYDFAYLSHLPYMTVAAPASKWELVRMLEMAVTVYEKEPHGIPAGCFAIRYPAKERFRHDPELLSAHPVEYGKGVVCFEPQEEKANGRDGRVEIGIIAIGEMLEEALQAAETLSAEGRTVAVFNARFFMPLDTEGIRAMAARADVLVTVEDAVRKNGFGESVLLLLAESGIRKPIGILALPNRPIEHGRIAEIHHRYGTDAEGIAAQCRTLLRAFRQE